MSEVSPAILDTVQRPAAPSACTSAGSGASRSKPGMSPSDGLRSRRWLPGNTSVPPFSEVKSVSIQIVARCISTSG